MQTVEQIENTVSEILRRGTFGNSVVKPRTHVDQFGDHISVEVVLADAAQAEEAKAEIEKRLGLTDVFLTVRGLWQIEKIGDPEVAYGPNGSPRTAVLVPILLRSGETLQQVTVAITKLAEMRFERILGTPLDLRQIARLVIENKLNLGGGISWNPATEEWLEVTSGNAADLSRGLQKPA